MYLDSVCTLTKTFGMLVCKVCFGMYSLDYRKWMFCQVEWFQAYSVLRHCKCFWQTPEPGRKEVCCDIWGL
jgi:hypothetical protein